jgi:hypothetical protein
MLLSPYLVKRSIGRDNVYSKLALHLSFLPLVALEYSLEDRLPGMGSESLQVLIGLCPKLLHDILHIHDAVANTGSTFGVDARRPPHPKGHVWRRGCNQINHL